MIDIKLLRDDPAAIRKAIKNRGSKIDIDEVIRLDEERRGLQKQVDDRRALKNQVGEKIAKASASEKKKLVSGMKEFDLEQDKMEKELAVVDKKFQIVFSQIPNIPLPDVPVGKDEKGNVVAREVGKKPKFDFEPKSSLEIGEALDIIDTARAAKVSGTRFGYLKNEAVLLEFALVRYALDTLIPEGFEPVLPPVLVREKTMWAMGFLDQHAEEIYKIDGEDQRLIGTSEQSVIPMHMNEILEGGDLPRRYVAFSTCFRREAGSYGKDTKGILRVHQFDKVEMLVLTVPSASEAEHRFLVSLQERLMTGLKLPYRVVNLCTGDFGAPSARTIDIETWIPSENRYRETHSASTTTDFQTRRLNIRCRPEGSGKLEFCHALNATAFTGRALIVILENYQEKDGSVTVPEVLRKYCGFERIGPR